MSGYAIISWFGYRFDDLKYDAPIGYVSVTANYTSEWEKWWFNPDNVRLYQFMGKDNVYFHTVYFPSVQIADGRDWTTLHHLSTTGTVSSMRWYWVNLLYRISQLRGWKVFQESEPRCVRSSG